MKLSAEEINALWKAAKKDVAMDYLNQNRLTDDELQKLLHEYNDQKTWRGKLTKLRQSFVQSLNLKYLKEQHTKHRAEDEQYKAELKAHYGLSDAEARKTLREFNYRNSYFGKAVEQLSNLGQKIKMHYFLPEPLTKRLTNAEIEALLSETNGKKNNPNMHDEREESANADSGREMN